MDNEVKKKILLDTDIGSDIDDAICLAYLLSQPECELLGITTVSGEPEKRAMLASSICLAARRPDIPIYPGTDMPLLTPQKQPIAKQAVALKDGVLTKWEHKAEFPRNDHIEFMRRTIRKFPNEVTLLAIGPMTNIALLFAVDPEIPSLLKELVLMCGIFSYKTPLYTCLTEWNALCDPYAAAIMYNADSVNIKSIGLDVTTHVTMNKKQVADRFKADVLQPVLDFSNVWFDENGLVTFHDPLAATVIFDSEICRFKRGNVDVDLESSRSRGLLYFNESPDGKNEVAVSVDSNRFFDHFFNTLDKH